MRLPRNNNPAEIAAFDTVCQRLAGFDDRLSAEYVDGWMTALAAGPRAAELEAWLLAMAGDAYDRAFADPEDRHQAERALRTRAVVLADQLDPEALYDAPDALRLSPLMLVWDQAARDDLVAEGQVTAEESADFVTGGEWADGFFAAMAQYSAAWSAGSDNDDEEAAALFGDLLQQVHVLRLAEGSEELKTHIQAVYGDEGADRDRLVDEACYAVQDLRLWWVEHAPKPETRRVEKTPGRNDLCPCGSGKKYKKCHGAAA
ncbi:MAG: UPF0149 family protein [Rubrivivax sp.]